ncbi:MAG: AAA family ATPase [Microcystaceae cyanobacterium]
MTIIALVNRKGGVGKTTVAVHLAHWLKSRAYSVLLVDADPQQSSANWLRVLGIEAKVLLNPEDILTLLPDLAEPFDFVIVDSPANLGEVTQNILLVCDIGLIPCKPSGLDTNSSAQLIRHLQGIQRVRKGEPKAALFINLAVPNTRLLSDSLELLQEAGFPFMKTVLYQRQVICDAPGQEEVVWTMKGTSARQAQADFERLFTEVMELIHDSG